MARNYNGMNPYYTEVKNSLEQYVPMPFQEMMVASNAIQARGDAIENQRMATDSLLANIEAQSPTHRAYVQKQGQSFRDASAGLLDQYGGNAADPEYIRKQRKLIMEFANDGNFRTIASANEKLKFNDKIARQMKAEGKLYINPQFRGVDSEGNLSDDVGEVELVNTLDKLRGEYEVAWKSMENNNKGTITNAANIKRQNERVMNSLASGSPEFAKLAQAYMQQGMSPDQAMNQIKSDITGLQGQYGIRTERDQGYFNYQLALSQHAMNAQKHRADMAALRAQMSPTGTNPLQGVMIEGAISAKDLNKDKKALLNDFRNHIGKDGNLEIKNKVLQSGAFGAHANEILTGAKIQNRSVQETLNYMRGELGWANKRGSAKQVADAYESMIKNDNIAPSAYIPGNSTIYNGIERTFGNNFDGANYYSDGKKMKADKAEVINEISKNKKLVGLSFVDGGSVLFKSMVGDKPVTVSIPLDGRTKAVMRNRLHIASIQNDFNDNEALLKAVKQNPDNYLVNGGDGYYAPRITSNGLKFAKTRVNTDGKFVDYERTGNGDLQYMNDAVVQQALLDEFSLLDSHLINIYKGSKD